MIVAAAVLVICSLTLWLWLIDTRLRGPEFLDWEPRRPVPWTVADLLATGLLGAVFLITFQLAAVRWLGLSVPVDFSKMKPGQQLFVSFASALASLLIVAVAVVIFRWHSRATARDLGWVPSKFGRDLTIGIVAYLLLIVPMLLIHVGVQKMWPVQQSHPFIELLIADPNWSFLLPIAFLAVIVAPVAEEFFFRVTLQGWLESMVVHWQAGKIPRGRDVVFAPADSSPPAAQPAAPAPSPGRLGPGDAEDPSDATAGDLVESSPDLENPYAIGATSSTADVRTSTVSIERGELSGIPTTPLGRWGPIVITSLLFALAHVGQGGAPVALFFLALGLGFIYQRTHRLLPTLIVHLLVNLTAVVQLWQYVEQAHQAR